MITIYESPAHSSLARLYQSHITLTSLHPPTPTPPLFFCVLSLLNHATYMVDIRQPMHMQPTAHVYVYMHACAHYTALRTIHTLSLPKRDELVAARRSAQAQPMPSARAHRAPTPTMYIVLVHLRTYPQGTSLQSGGRRRVPFCYVPQAGLQVGLQAPSTAHRGQHTSAHAGPTSLSSIFLVQHTYIKAHLVARCGDAPCR
jgi:hypothetical protein